MSSSQPGPSAPPGAKQRNRWKWATAALALAVVGLIAWNLSTRSDLDAAEEDVSDLTAQVEAGDDAAQAARGVYEDLSEQLGATDEELAQTEEKLADAEQAAAESEAKAEAARQEAGQSQDAERKAEAEAEQARAENEAAESRLTIATECAKAYVGAFGDALGEDGGGAAGDKLETITERCRAALEDA